MLRRIVLGTIALLSTSALVAQAAPKDDLLAAAQKLGDSANYSWTSTAANAGGGGFGGGTQTGKTQKDGLTTLSIARQDTTTEIVKQGDKIAIKGDAGWQTAAEASGGDAGGGGFNPAMFMVMQAQNLKLPAAQVQEIAGKLDAVTPADDALTATLSEAQVKDLLAFRFPRPAAGAANAADAPAPPTVADGKGTVKFWIKDGVLSKYELHLTGTMSFGGNDNPIDRTTTIEIKDVGSTTIDVPAEAKAKLG